MGELEINSNTIAANNKPVSESRRTMRRAILTPMVCSLLASFGIFGGVASLFVGIVFVLLHSMVNGDRMFDRLGTGLLIVAIPMILTGSVFLDEINIKK